MISTVILLLLLRNVLLLVVGINIWKLGLGGGFRNWIGKDLMMYRSKIGIIISSYFILCWKLIVLLLLFTLFRGHSSPFSRKRNTVTFCTKFKENWWKTKMSAAKVVNGWVPQPLLSGKISTNNKIFQLLRKNLQGCLFFVKKLKPKLLLQLFV